ncbi:MAG: hypothetical protein ABW022_25815 [Actinoplanes sp.]
MDGIDAAEDWLDSWAARAGTQAERAVDLSRRVAALTGSAENRDGSIRVSVGASGQVERLQLSDGDLARRIMEVIHRAQADLSARVADEVEATVGADSATGSAVIHSYSSRFPSEGTDSRDR